MSLIRMIWVSLEGVARWQGDVLGQLPFLSDSLVILLVIFQFFVICEQEATVHLSFEELKLWTSDTRPGLPLEHWYVQFALGLGVQRLCRLLTFFGIDAAV